MSKKPLPQAPKHAKSALRKRSLVAVKKASMRNSRSSIVGQSKLQGAFGLIPRGVDIQVVAWPDL